MLSSFVLDTEVFPFPTDLDNPDASSLSPDELARADRYYFDRDRRRHILCRAALRQLLGERLRISPREVVFENGPYGKPRIAGGHPNIDFNLSHSGEMAAIAITRGEPVGIDIEKIRPMHDLNDIAKRYFAPRENEWLQAQSPEARVGGFFRLWTLKEAVLKADGRGLSFPLNEIEIVFDACGPVLLGGAWRLRELDLVPGYAAAIALLPALSD